MYTILPSGLKEMISISSTLTPTNVLTIFWRASFDLSEEFSSTESDTLYVFKLSETLIFACSITVIFFTVLVVSTL